MIHYHHTPHMPPLTQLGSCFLVKFLVHQRSSLVKEQAAKLTSIVSQDCATMLQSDTIDQVCFKSTYRKYILAQQKLRIIDSANFHRVQARKHIPSLSFACLSFPPPYSSSTRNCQGLPNYAKWYQPGYRLCYFKLQLMTSSNVLSGQLIRRYLEGKFFPICTTCSCHHRHLLILPLHTPGM